MKSKFLKAVAIAGLALSTTFAHAALINGNFDDGTAWNSVTGSGSTSIAGGVAQLSTGFGIDIFSAVLVQGDNGSFTFGSPIVLANDIAILTFDIRFQNDTFLGGEPAGIGAPRDSLQVALYDAFDFSGASDVFFNHQLSPDTLFTTVTMDVGALAGNSLALSFELFDENDGFDTSVFLDNVMFSTAQTVPEPSSLILCSLGLFGLISAKRRKNKVIHC